MQTVTMNDVASAAGVSRALVSLAYRDAYGVNAETREHILKVGNQLGYHPNRVAAQLAGKAQATIGVFLQDLHNDVFADIFDGIREVCDANQKNTVLAIGKTDGSRDVSALEALLESRVDLVIAAGLTLPDELAKKIAGKVRLISIMRQIDGTSSVYSDNLLGARLATEHLIANGHKAIAFIANPPSDGYLDRTRGYEDTMELHGLKVNTVAGSYSRTENALLAKALLTAAERPSAVFAHNDQAALGVLDAAKELGIEVARDLSVVGYDNSTLSQTPTTALTTVDVHGFELGKVSAELALELLELPIDSHQQKTLEPTLVERASVSHVSDD